MPCFFKVGVMPLHFHRRPTLVFTNQKKSKEDLGFYEKRQIAKIAFRLGFAASPIERQHALTAVRVAPPRPSELTKVFIRMLYFWIVRETRIWRFQLIQTLCHCIVGSLNTFPVFGAFFCFCGLDLSRVLGLFRFVSVVCLEERNVMMQMPWEIHFLALALALETAENLALEDSRGGIGSDAYPRVQTVSCGICARWWWWWWW